MSAAGNNRGSVRIASASKKLSLLTSLHHRILDLALSYQSSIKLCLYKADGKTTALEACKETGLELNGHDVSGSKHRARRLYGVGVQRMSEQSRSRVPIKIIIRAS